MVLLLFMFAVFVGVLLVCDDAFCCGAAGPGFGPRLSGLEVGSQHPWLRSETGGSQNRQGTVWAAPGVQGAGSSGQCPQGSSIMCALQEDCMSCVGPSATVVLHSNAGPLICDLLMLGDVFFPQT